MSNLLFSVLAATSLAATGIGAPVETRSAQSLPAEHLVVAPAHGTSSGNLHKVNRLVDVTPDNAGSDQSGKSKCEQQGKHWDDKKLRCGAIWPVPFIGAATTAGFIYALTSHDDSGQSPVSN